MRLFDGSEFDGVSISQGRRAAVLRVCTTPVAVFVRTGSAVFVLPVTKILRPLRRIFRRLRRFFQRQQPLCLWELGLISVSITLHLLTHCFYELFKSTQAWIGSAGTHPALISGGYERTQ